MPTVTRNTPSATARLIFCSDILTPVHALSTKVSLPRLSLFGVNIEEIPPIRKGLEPCPVFTRSNSQISSRRRFPLSPTLSLSPSTSISPSPSNLSISPALFASRSTPYLERSCPRSSPSPLSPSMTASSKSCSGMRNSSPATGNFPCPIESQYVRRFETFHHLLFPRKECAEGPKPRYPE